MPAAGVFSSLSDTILRRRPGLAVGRAANSASAQQHRSIRLTWASQACRYWLSRDKQAPKCINRLIKEIQRQPLDGLGASSLPDVGDHLAALLGGQQLLDGHQALG